MFGGFVLLCCLNGLVVLVYVGCFVVGWLGLRLGDVWVMCVYIVLVVVMVVAMRWGVCF